MCLKDLFPWGFFLLAAPIIFMNTPTFLGGPIPHDMSKTFDGPTTL